MTETRQEYTVQGRWPFPIDMLRRDDAAPATEADSDMIRKLSAEHMPEDDSGLKGYRVKLVRRPLNKWDAPNDKRWKSFQWEVVPESLPEHLRPIERRKVEDDIIPVKTVQDAKNRVYDITRTAESDPEAATGMERDFHRDALHSIANGLTTSPQEVARIAFETCRLEFPRW